MAVESKIDPVLRILRAVLPLLVMLALMLALSTTLMLTLRGEARWVKSMDMAAAVEPNRANPEGNFMVTGSVYSAYGCETVGLLLLHVFTATPKAMDSPDLYRRPRDRLSSLVDQVLAIGSAHPLMRRD